MAEETLSPMVAFFKMRSPEAFTNRHIEEASKPLKVDDDGEFLFRIHTNPKVFTFAQTRFYNCDGVKTFEVKDTKTGEKLLLRNQRYMVLAPNSTSGYHLKNILEGSVLDVFSSI